MVTLDLYQCLTTNNLNRLKELFIRFFASIPHDWYRKNTLANYEGYYASIIYCYFAALGLDVIAEYVTSNSQIDLTIRFTNCVYILEFKVSDNLSEKNSALDQIKSKGYSRKYLDRKRYLIGILFNKSERNIIAFDWEEEV